MHANVRPLAHVHAKSLHFRTMKQAYNWPNMVKIQLICMGNIDKAFH